MHNPSEHRSREDLVRSIRDALRCHGWDGTTLEVLTEATGLQRASLYHHFPGGKREMAAAALASVEDMMRNDLIPALLRPGEPRARLRSMLRALDIYYREGQLGCLFAVFIRPGDHGLSRRVTAALREWLDALAAVARDAGADAPDRCAEAMLAHLQGALVVAAALGKPAFRRSLKVCETLLLP